MRTIFSLCCAFALTTACATVRPVPLTLLAASPTWEEQRAAELRSFWGDEFSTGMDGAGPHLFFVDADDPCLRLLARRFTEALDGTIAADEYRGAAIELSAADLEHARNRDGGALLRDKALGANDRAFGGVP